MRTKSTAQVQNQMYRIDKMLMDGERNQNNLKRFKRWVETSSTIQCKMLAYFGVNHLWENPAYKRIHEPLPYEVRVAR